jgi:arylsulfatase A-like enzyme
VAIANWPGKLKPGKVDVPWHIADWTPTICSLAGYKPNADLKWDGQNMWPVLSGETSVAPPRPLYMVAPAFRSRALRFGEWKLVVHGDGDKRKTELYDLSKDPSETTDLAGSQPAKLAEMLAKLAEVAKRDRDAVAND